MSERVLNAAKALDYGTRRLELYRGTIRIEVILVKPVSQLFIRLNQAFERIAASLDRSILIHRTFVDQGDAKGIATYIEKPAFRREGLIVAVPDHLLVAESLRKARRMGVEVVQIVTRSTDDSVPYVGIDHYAAGRTAALLMSRMLETREGSFIALCSPSYSGQRERVSGFSDYLESSRNPLHRFPTVMFSAEQDVSTVEVIRETIEREGDVIGLYSAGSGNKAIASILKTLEAKVFWIGFEFDDLSAVSLRSGLMDVVIDQAPEVQARRALDIVMRRLDLIEVDVNADPVQFLIMTSENL